MNVSRKTIKGVDMKRFVALFLVAVALATAPAFGDFQAGQDAHDKGDYKTALREWQPLAEQGDSFAQFFLGLMYKNGEGVPQDYKKAIKYYTLSAEQGNISAQSNLGVMNYVGEGVAKNAVRAHMWINISALNGNEHGIVARDNIAKKMTDEQILEAQKMALECIAKDYKGC